MILPDARTWFRFRCKIMNNIKGNTTSAFRENMQCRHCTPGEDEKQEHVEKIEFTKVIIKSMNIAKEREYMILWTKINKNLR